LIYFYEFLRGASWAFLVFGAYFGFYYFDSFFYFLFAIFPGFSLILIANLSIQNYELKQNKAVKKDS